MGDINITSPEWRLVQVGRVVVLQSGPEAGRLAAIVEVIDHKRVRFSRSSRDGKGQIADVEHITYNEEVNLERDDH